MPLTTPTNNSNRSDHSSLSPSLRPFVSLAESDTVTCNPLIDEEAGTDGECSRKCSELGHLKSRLEWTDTTNTAPPPPQHSSTPTPLFESAKPLLFVGGDKGGKVVVSLTFNESASGGGVQVCYLHLFSAGDTEGSAARALMLFRPLGARRWDG